MTDPDAILLTDNDPEMAAFFRGDDLSGPTVPDGGKGLIPEADADRGKLEGEE